MNLFELRAEAERGLDASTEDGFRIAAVNAHHAREALMNLRNQIKKLENDLTIAERIE